MSDPMGIYCQSRDFGTGSMGVMIGRCPSGKPLRLCTSERWLLRAYK